MKLPKFSHIGEDIWHIDLEGKCRKISKQDEEAEAHAIMDALDNTPNCPYCLTCSMTCPEKEDGYVEIQMEMHGLKTDDIIDDIIRYLIDRYDLYNCSIDLSAWQNLDCTGWVFELANYNFRRSKMADIVTLDTSGEAHFTRHEEFAILDRNGRVQIPPEFLTAMGMEGNRVKLSMEDGRVIIRAPEKEDAQA